jgi:hypothetical protein
MNRLTILGAPLALLLTAYQTHSAYARHRHHHHSQRYLASHNTQRCTLTNGGRQRCGPSVRGARAFVMDTNGSRARRITHMASDGSIIGARPAGCPHAYCGCGLRKYLGLTDKRLNLARNWARLFPHVAGPRAGVAAVRRHHVMYIEGRAANGQWLVRDYNSGGGLSRVHTRDVHGYIFVLPRG